MSVGKVKVSATGYWFNQCRTNTNCQKHKKCKDSPQYLAHRIKRESCKDLKMLNFLQNNVSGHTVKLVGTMKLIYINF